MPNANYRKGYAAERRARRELEADGWATHRSGGSRGVDIVGIQTVMNRVVWVLYVSVKSGKRRPTEADKQELRWAKPHSGLIEREIWYYAPRQPVEIISVS